MLFDQTRRFSVGNKKSKKYHKSLDLWDLTVHYLVSSAEGAGFEPAKPTGASLQGLVETGCKGIDFF